MVIKLNKITKIVVDIMFYLGIVCIIAVPFMAKYIGRYYGYDNRQIVVFSTMLFISGVAAVYILYEFRRIFRTLVGGDPFVKSNATGLGRMAAACIVIAAVYLVKCFTMFSFATLVIVIVFGIGSLFCLVLKDVFTQAVIYKEENDWTV